MAPSRYAHSCMNAKDERPFQSARSQTMSLCYGCLTASYLTVLRVIRGAIHSPAAEPTKLASNSPDGDQMRVVPSAPEEAIRSPSSDIEIATTGPLCPCSVLISSPVSTSQILISPSLFPATTRRALGKKPRRYHHTPSSA